MSQREQIRDHLLTGKSVTPLEALGVFGCFRLAARIEELRDEGFVIRTDKRTDAKGKTYARYTLDHEATVMAGTQEMQNSKEGV